MTTREYATPRRSQLEKMTPAELAIRDVVALVESLGADVRLTDAVVLLAAAQESVADFIDGVDKRRYVRYEDATPTPRAAVPEEALQALKTVAREAHRCVSKARSCDDRYWIPRQFFDRLSVALTAAFPPMDPNAPKLVRSALAPEAGTTGEVTDTERLDLLEAWSEIHGSEVIICALRQDAGFERDEVEVAVYTHEARGSNIRKAIDALAARLAAPGETGEVERDA